MSLESRCTIGCGRQNRSIAWTPDGRAASGWAGSGDPARTWWRSAQGRFGRCERWPESRSTSAGRG
eukprot:15327164-Alexandrium_andersonii.AAC.1